MGFLGNLGDTLSGKTYKRNTLIGANIAKLLEKSQSLPDAKFIKHWSFACLASIHIIIDELLFSNVIPNDINVFKRNINKLDKERVSELIKLLAGFHLSAFTSNEGNLAFLEKAGLTEKKFSDDMFSVFSFTKDDEKLFRELDEIYKSEDYSKHSIYLYRAMLKSGFDLSGENDAFAMTATRTIISTAYQFFVDNLRDKIKGK